MFLFQVTSLGLQAFKLCRCVLIETPTHAVTKGVLQSIEGEAGMLKAA